MGSINGNEASSETRKADEHIIIFTLCLWDIYFRLCQDYYDEDVEEEEEASADT